MIGPKTTCILQRLGPATSDGYGGETAGWMPLQTFRATFVPIRRDERVRQGREAVTATHILAIDTGTISDNNISYLTEASRIKIGTKIYQIKSVTSYEGPGKHYGLDLEIIE